MLGRGAPLWVAVTSSPAGADPFSLWVAAETQVGLHQSRQRSHSRLPAGWVEGRSGPRFGMFQPVLLPLNAFLPAPLSLLLWPLLLYKSFYFSGRWEQRGGLGVQNLPEFYQGAWTLSLGDAKLTEMFEAGK